MSTLQVLQANTCEHLTTKRSKKVKNDTQLNYANMAKQQSRERRCGKKQKSRVEEAGNDPAIFKAQILVEGM